MGSGDRDQRMKELEEAFLREHERLERIFDTVPLMMTIYDPSTKVFRVNRAFERLIGWSSDEIGGVSLMEECYPDPEYREQAREYMHACRPWTNVRLSDDTQLGIGVDLTERKRGEAALRESEEALRHAHRLKDEFLATLAHELRNPLSPMRNAVEILRGHGGDREVAQQALSVLDRQLSLMVRLVDDLLDISRITRGKIDLVRSEVDLDGVLQRAIESTRGYFRENEHQLKYQPPAAPRPTVDGDPIRLEQIFSNLLNNAAKFTPRGGVVTIELSPNAHQAVARVRDTGIGIASDILSRVFETFVQGDRSVDRARGGLGIGLSLVKRLVELHGGEVDAFSAGPGQGSEFVVRLPLAHRLREAAVGPDLRAPEASQPEPETRPKAEELGRARAERPHEPGLEPVPRKRQTVLMVDDNVDAAKTLAFLLSTWGYEALVAHDGPSGVELGKTHELHAVIMDLGMPGMSGYSAARLMRAEPGLANVLMIALTGWGQQDARRESAAAGFDRHLVKPVDVALLRRILKGDSRAASVRTDRGTR
jgi:signal transduction histidine kinase/ActR/RegA family two-component response regulator